jgi:hypothetical protein
MKLAKPSCCCEDTQSLVCEFLGKGYFLHAALLSKSWRQQYTAQFPRNTYEKADNLEQLIWLHSQGLFTLPIKRPRIQVRDRAASRGQLDILKWLHSASPTLLFAVVKKDYPRDHYDHLSHLNYIGRDSDIELSDNDDGSYDSQSDIYEIAMKQGHSHIITWIHENMICERSDKRYPLLLPLYEAIHVAASNGNLDALIWLLQPAANDINTHVRDAMRAAMSSSQDHVIHYWMKHYFEQVKQNAFFLWDRACRLGKTDWIQLFYIHFHEEIDLGISNDKLEYEKNGWCFLYRDTDYQARIYSAFNRSDSVILDLLLQVYGGTSVIKTLHVYRLLRYVARHHNTKLFQLVCDTFDYKELPESIRTQYENNYTWN